MIFFFFSFLWCSSSIYPPLSRSFLLLLCVVVFFCSKIDAGLGTRSLLIRSLLLQHFLGIHYIRRLPEKWGEGRKKTTLTERDDPDQICCLSESIGQHRIALEVAPRCIFIYLYVEKPIDRTEFSISRVSFSLLTSSEMHGRISTSFLEKSQTRLDTGSTAEVDSRVSRPKT